MLTEIVNAIVELDGRKLSRAVYRNDFEVIECL